MGDDYDHLYKVVLVGDTTSGKTHLLSRYIKGTLPKSPTATIGVEFATRTVPLVKGGVVKLQIWDTAGQERYRAITSAHYRRALGAFVVYDVTNKVTFAGCTKWLEDIQQNCEPNVVHSRREQGGPHREGSILPPSSGGHSRRLRPPTCLLYTSPSPRDS